MKTVQSHLLGSARSLRLSRTSSRSIKFTSARGALISPRNFSVTARRKEEDLAMARKGQKFELKTPKGTKDCESASKYPRPTLTYTQGRAKTWSFETRSSLPSLKSSSVTEQLQSILRSSN